MALCSRVWCEKDFAELLFKAASKCQLRPGRESRMAVYLDRVRLLDGQRFDIGFINGLANSTVFAPLISTSAAKSFLKIDEEDFVLMEKLRKQGSAMSLTFSESRTTARGGH